jgi:hypothetical protein
MPRGLVGVLADEDTAHLRWFGNGPQPLSVFTSRHCSSLAVGETASPFEDGISGAADFVEECDGDSSFRPEVRNERVQYRPTRSLPPAEKRWHAM